jgi:hypothetical protein
MNACATVGCNWNVLNGNRFCKKCRDDLKRRGICQGCAEAQPLPKKTRCAACELLLNGWLHERELNREYVEERRPAKHRDHGARENIYETKFGG